MSDDSRTRLRNDLLAGATSRPAEPAERTYFEHLRQRVLRAKALSSPQNRIKPKPIN